jgi:signal transduction histidine kinase
MTSSQSRKFLPVLVVMLVLSIGSWAQSHRIDSIRQVALAHSNDTLGVLSKIELCYEFRFRSQDSAIHYGEGAIALAKKLNFEKGWAQAESDLGVVYYDRTDFAKTNEIWNHSLSLRAKLKDTMKMAGLYLNLGSLRFREGKYEASLVEQLKALNLYEKKKFDDGMSRALNNIAAVYERQNQWDKALEYYNRSYEIKKKANNAYQLAQTQINIGNIYFLKKQYRTAIREMNSAIKKLDGLVYAKDYLAIAYNNISDVYRSMGLYDSALVTTEQSLALRESIDDIQGIVSSLNSKGSILTKLKRYEPARLFLQQALDSADAHHLMLDRQRIHFNLFELYHEVDKSKEALDHFTRYSQIRDSLLDESSRKNINELQVKYETEQKERELLEQKIELAKSNNLMLILLFATVILMILGVVVYRTQQARRRKTEKEARFQLELAEARLETELHQDRLRISRELHDNIGSRLLFLSTAAENFENSSADKAEQVSSFARDTLHELRRTVWLINRDSVSLEELQLKLREYFSFLNEDSQISIQIKVTGDTTTVFRSQKAAAIFRISQEAVSNAIKHGKAHAIEIVLLQEGQSVTLSVTDNGQGFDTQQISTGNGLNNMKAHTQGAKGRIDVNSAPGRGTTVSVVLPLE